MASSTTSSKRKASGELVSPPPKRTHLGDHEGNEQAPPPSSPQRAASTSTSPGVEEEDDDLLCRIQDGIDYVRDQQSKGEAAKQTTCFELSTTSPSPALDLLRRYATQIYTSPTYEVYELGVPRPDWVAQGILPGIHDPQWWHDKTLAEIKAGPYGDENDIKRATANLKGLQTKKNKKKVPTAREKEIEWKLREGTRRQELGLKMWGSDTEETDDETEEEGLRVDGGDDSESEETEEEMPVKRSGRRMAAKAPRGRARLSMIVEEEESDSEEDIPIVSDPRYLRYLQLRSG